MANTSGNEQLHSITLPLEIDHPAEKKKGTKHWILVVFSVLAIVVGQSSGTLLSRFYFEEGGDSRWLQTLIPCVGWPILLFPILVNGREIPMTAYLNIKFFLICAALGATTAADNMLYSWGVSFLPVSTFSLLCSTQLAFTAVFTYILVGQRITTYILNSLVLLILSTVLLALHSDNDRPEGVSDVQFIWGFVFTVLASAMFALICPLMQLVFSKVIRKETFGVVLETQAYIFIFASVVCVIGLLGSGELMKLKHEADTFRSGRLAYYMVMGWSAVAWQLCFLGAFGLVFLYSSFFSNVIGAVTLPIVPVLAVVFFGDAMDGIKIIAMVLGVWGFVSYVYGELLDYKISSS